nr:protein BTG3-like [Pogona vitticeps]
MAATHTMKEDIEMGVRFILSILSHNVRLGKEQLDRFGDSLVNILCERFTGHWYPEKPIKGQAYRCIRINRTDRVDSSLKRACQDAGIDYSELSLPRDFTLWIDPGEVSCRLGENNYPFKVSEEFRRGQSSPELETSDYHSESPTPSEGSSEDEGRTKSLEKIQASHRSRPGRTNSAQAPQYYYVPSPLWVPWQHNAVTYLPAYQPLPLYYVNLPSKPPAARKPNPELLKRLTKRASKS